MAEDFGKKDIWRVFFILLAITILEFIVALAVPKDVFGWDPADVKVVKNILYGIMTIAKAIYIVAFFMHLKFEKVNMIYSILLPILFIIGVIAVLIYEAGYWLDTRPEVTSLLF